MVSASALGLSYSETPIYQSQAKVLVKSISVGPGSEATASNLQTESELATSTAVAELAAEQLGSDESPSSLRGGLTVEQAAETEILLFYYSSTSPEQARDRAQAFGNAYLEFRRQQVVDDLLSGSSSLQQRIDTLNEQLQSINDQIDRSAETDTELESQASSLVSQIAILQAQLAELTRPEDLQVGQVVEPAFLPTAPISPNHVRAGALGLFGGLGLGILLAFLRERLDDRLRGRADLEAGIEATVLAVIPKLTKWRKRSRPSLVTLDEPLSAASEAYRALRTAVLFAAPRRKFKSLIVTSPHPGEGKTTTTANLGVVLAQAGKRVVIISADLRKPRIHTFFGMTSSREAGGLTAVLAEEADPLSELVPASVDNLHILPSGVTTENPVEMLSSDAMGRLLSELGDTFDFVLLDAAPVMPVADTVALIPLIDAILLVADAEGTTRTALMQTRQQLDQVDGQVLGAVLNNFDVSKARTYPYYYGYYGPAYHSDAKSASVSP